MVLGQREAEGVTEGEGELVMQRQAVDDLEGAGVEEGESVNVVHPEGLRVWCALKVPVRVGLGEREMEGGTEMEALWEGDEVPPAGVPVLLSLLGVRGAVREGIKEGLPVAL